MRASPVVAITLLLTLTSCTPSSSLRPVIDLAQQVSGKTGASQTQINIIPAFSYLRVQIGNRVAFFVLGYLDPHPEGMVEVWFSAEKEVLRLRHGRLMGVSGTPTEWLNVTYPRAPAWSNTLAAATYERTRDVAPGYRYGLAETVQLRSISAPEKSNLLGIPPESLSWFLESSTDQAALKPTLYALRHDQDGPRVVYSETCLDTDLCFSWQRWPAN